MVKLAAIWHKMQEFINSESVSNSCYNLFVRAISKWYNCARKGSCTKKVSLGNASRAEFLFRDNNNTASSSLQFIFRSFLRSICHKRKFDQKYQRTKPHFIDNSLASISIKKIFKAEPQFPKNFDTEASDKDINGVGAESIKNIFTSFLADNWR